MLDNSLTFIRRRDAAAGRSPWRGLKGLPVGGLALLAAVLFAGPAAANGPVGFADLAAKVNPAVVNIATTQEWSGREGGPMIPQFPPGSPFEEFFKDFFDRQGEGGQQQQMPRPKSTSLGSGFVIDSEGYIVTNNHVIADASEIEVTFPDDRTYAAELVGRDPKTDIALLKIEPDAPIKSVEWGDSDETRVGDWVLAIGNPFGLGNTVTAGIVSARARDINAGPFDDFLQTDASINRGNSGGPMFNMDGQVIGVNTAIYSPSGGSVGIGFAVPASLAKNVVDQLREFGRTRRGWLGVRIQTVTDDLAESLGLEKAEGALVASVTPDSPASAAGMEVGDVILNFNGKSVSSMRELPRIVAETKIGKEVPVEIWRNGAGKTLAVNVGELDETEVAALPEEDMPSSPPSATSTVDELGLTLAAITPELRERFQLGDDIGGVIVVDVDPAGVAAEKGIQPGDIIVEVAQEEVTSPDEVAAKIKEQSAQDKSSILLLVSRQGDLQFVAVRLKA